MSQADEPHTPSRRSFLRMAPAGLATATGIAAVLPTLMAPRERLDHHLAEVTKAWTEMVGKPPFIVEVDPQNRFILIATRVDPV